MEKTYIKPGTKLVLELESKRETEPGFRLYSTFEEDGDDGMFYIAAPMIGASLYPIQVGEVINIQMFAESAVFKFSATLTQRVRRGGFAFLEMRRDTEITRTQRRDDFRLDISLPVTIKSDYGSSVVGARNAWGMPKARKYDAKTADISGGGMAIRSDVEALRGDRVWISFALDDGEKMEIMADVCWCERQPTDALHKWLFGVRFLYQSGSDKEKVVKYVFRVQQRRLKHDLSQPLYSDSLF